MQEVWGFDRTIDGISKAIGVSEDKMLKKWSAGRFYNKVRMYAWEAHCQKNYHKLISPEPVK